MQNKLFVWQMIKESVDNLGGNATYSQIKEYIKKKYGEVNERTITAQITVCTVNHLSRIHYQENKKPRIANSKYDFLYTVARGQVTLYDPKRHGIWEIREEQGILIVAQKDNYSEANEMNEEVASEEENFAFPFESHLRDFIAKNIESIKVNGKNLNSRILC
jgi:endonuclease